MNQPSELKSLLTLKSECHPQTFENDFDFFQDLCRHGQYHEESVDYNWVLISQELSVETIGSLFRVVCHAIIAGSFPSETSMSSLMKLHDLIWKWQHWNLATPEALLESLDTVKVIVDKFVAENPGWSEIGAQYRLLQVGIRARMGLSPDSV